MTNDKTFKIRNGTNHQVLITRSIGMGGVANFYNQLRPHLPNRYCYCVIHNPHARTLFAKASAFPLILIYFLRELQRADVVCLNPSLVPKAYYRDMVFLILAKITRRKVIVLFRGWGESFEYLIRKTSLRFWLFSRTYARADGYFVLGDCFRKKLCDMGVFRPEKIYRISTIASGQPPSVADIEKKCASLPGEMRCLFLSRLVPGKGLDEAITIYVELKRRLVNSRVTLTIAGEGPERVHAENRVRREGLEDVHFLGEVRGKEKEHLMREMHILLFPSYSEGLPNAILESMLYGLVIASTPVGGVPDIVQDGKNGVLFHIKEYRKAVGFILKIISSPDSAKKIALRNRSFALQNFRPHVVANKMVRVIESL